MKTSITGESTNESPQTLDPALAAMSLVKRCDWKDANAYPASHDTNATMWAWEFLRRNRDYQRSIDHWEAYKSETPRPMASELERYAHVLQVGWNVYDLLPPDQSYAELVRREPERMENFAFSGQAPAVYYPQFNAEDIERRSRGSEFLDSVFVGAAPTTAYLATNEVLVRLCLDGDIDYQLDQIRDYMNTPRFAVNDAGEKEIRTPREVRPISLEKSVTSTNADGERDPEYDVFGVDYQASSVLLNHLWYALRTVDAIAELGGILTANQLGQQLLDHYNDEIRQQIPALKTFAEMREAGLLRLRKRRVDALCTYAIRYSLTPRYVDVSHTDLATQARGDRRGQKKKKP